MKKSTSKSMQFGIADLKRTFVYALYICAVGLVANLTGAQEFLSEYIGAQRSAVIMSIVGVAVNKFVTDYSKKG